MEENEFDWAEKMFQSVKMEFIPDVKLPKKGQRVRITYDSADWLGDFMTAPKYSGLKELEGVYISFYQDGHYQNLRVNIDGDVVNVPFAIDKIHFDFSQMRNYNLHIYPVTDDLKEAV